MGILNRLFKTTPSPKIPNLPPPPPPKPGDIAWERSDIYTLKDFPKYNPDDLIGTKGFSIYRKMMKDSQVKAVVNFKRYAVISRSWSFDVPEKDDEMEKQAEFFKAVIDEMQGSFSDAMLGILSGIYNGFSLSEKVYKVFEYDGKAYWGLKDLKIKPADTFSFITDEFGNITNIKQNQGGRDIELPIGKFIHFVNDPDVDAHYGESDLRACYREYWSKDIIIKFQNIHLEKHASGFVWASVEGSLNSKQETDLKNFLKNITAQTGAMVPANVSLNYMSPATTDAFEKAIAGYDKAIAKSVLVPNLLGMSEQGYTGSYSQSQTQLEAFFWVLDAVANRLAEVLNEQLFRELSEWNFGTSTFPKFKFEPMTDAQKMDLARGWSELVSKGAVTKSESDEKYLRNLLGFPEKSEEESPEGEGDPIPPTPGKGALPPDETHYEESDQPDNEEWIAAQEEEKRNSVLRELISKPWLKRVDFKKAERLFNNSGEEYSEEMADIMASVRLGLEKDIEKMAGERSFGNVKPQEIAEIKPRRKFISLVRKTTRDYLTAALEDSYAQAKDELPKQNRKTHYASVRELFQYEKFLQSRSMKIAGVLDQVITGAVQNILENGIRFDKTLKEIMTAIREDTTLLSILPSVDSLGRKVNVPARLENIARTNIADAVNQGRQALFNDPALKGFVEAFEYSAILDTRTTPVCQAYHGKIRREWGEYAPPNHYQCRSILIPVTAIDGWDGKQDNLPASVKPQQGFM